MAPTRPVKDRIGLDVFLKTPPTRIKILGSNIEEMATRKNRVSRKNRANRKNRSTRKNNVNATLMGGKRRRGSRKGSRRGRRGTRRH